MKMLYLHHHPLEKRAANNVQVLSMCNAFSAEGIKLILAVPGEVSSSNGIIPNYINKKGNKFDFCRIPITDYGFKKNIFRSNHEVNKLILNISPDVVFMRSVRFITHIKKINVPFVYESHNATGEKFSITNKYWRTTIKNGIKDLNNLGLITISHALKKYWIRIGIPPKKIHVLHDGFEKKDFENVVTKNTARRILNLPINRKIVTYTGSLYSNRGIDLIIEVAKKNKNLFFLVVGGPEEKKRFYEKVVKKEKIFNINLSGYIDHSKIPYYLFASDVLLAIWSKKVETINYCSPLKIFEYMASGRPIVAHAFNTISEVLTHKKNSYLAGVDDIDDLQNGINYCLDKRSSLYLGNNARNKAFEKFTWGIRAKYIIDEIIKKNL